MDPIIVLYWEGEGSIVRKLISEFFKFRASYYIKVKQSLKEVIEGRKRCQNGTMKDCSKYMI